MSVAEALLMSSHLVFWSMPVGGMVDLKWRMGVTKSGFCICGVTYASWEHTRFNVQHIST